MVSHQIYPSNGNRDWLTQCLLEKDACRFFFDAALVAEPSDGVVTVLKTASWLDVSWIESESSDVAEIAASSKPWTRVDGTVPSLSVERREDGTLGITYSTLGNDVDTNAFPGAALSPSDGCWNVSFVHVDMEGNRRAIPTNAIRFTGQFSLEAPVKRSYEEIAVEESATTGVVVVSKTGETATLTPDRYYAFAVPTAPATYEMVWDDHLASGHIEAWVYYDNSRLNGIAFQKADLSDWLFGPKAVGGVIWNPSSASVAMNGQEYKALLDRIAAFDRQIQLAPLPFGEYREAVSGSFSKDPRAIDLWEAFHGKEPILEIEGLSTVLGHLGDSSLGLPGTGFDWRVDGETLFGTYRWNWGSTEWLPSERGLHVLDVEHYGVAGKVAVWFDEPRWAPLPGAGPNDPVGAKAVSLYPWTNAVSIDVALDAMDTNRPVWIRGKWITKTDGHIDQDQWQDAHYLFMEDDPNKRPGVWAGAWETATGYTPMRLLWEIQDELGSGKRKKEAELILSADWGPLRYSTWNTRQYLIVDVSGGPDAEKWPVTVCMFEPEGRWSDDVYKTDKIVLRRVEAGDFTMGSPTNEPYRDRVLEAPHTVRLTETYYISVYEITQAQWEHVMGEKPPCYNAQNYSDGRLPVRRVSYDDVRGADRSQNWPADMGVDAESFFGRLRAKADGFAWDLPTEAQWECACRSGTQTAWGDGSEINLYQTEAYGTWLDDSLSKLGRYAGNAKDGAGGYSDGPTVVGSYQPNKWGIHDMHGNVSEWTRDRKTSGFGDERAEDGAFVDPKGNTIGRTYAIRGGSYASGAEKCRAAWRHGNNDDTEHDTRANDRGFRIGAFVWPFGLDWDGPHENYGGND